MDISYSLRLKFNQLFEFIYPPRCLCCGNLSEKNKHSLTYNALVVNHNSRDLCKVCEERLPWIVNACQQCALPLPDDAEGGVLCGRCLKKTPYYDDSISLFSFKDTTVQLIHLLKFHEKLAAARLLGDLLSVTMVREHIDKPDCLLPVPLYKKRLKERGFNQSIELARSLQKTWRVPLDTHSVVRIRNTQSQVELDAKQRRKNIKGAFKVISTFNYKHVAIVDDVVTTMSTVNELARALKQHGVKRVSVYSIARAPIK